MDERLSDIMLEICEDEFSEYKGLPEHKFSLCFRRKMNKLIKEQYAPQTVPVSTVRKMKYAIIALVTAVFLLTGFIVTDTLYVRTEDDFFGFTSFTARYSGTAPKTIENYYEPAVPEGFVKNEEFSYSTEKFHTSAYYNGDFGYMFSQSVISEFYLGVETDKAIVEYSYGKDNFIIRYEGGSIIDIVRCDGKYVYHLQTVEGCLSLLDTENLQEIFPEEILTLEDSYMILMEK